MSDVITVIKESQLKEDKLYLPDRQLDPKLYLRVKKQLQVLGGKWHTGKKAFVFPRPVQPIIELYLNNTGATTRKEMQFHPTPDNIISHMLMLCGTYGEIFQRLGEGTILEPSAGQGHIIKFLQANYQTKTIHCLEKNPVNRAILSEIPNIYLYPEPDFLAAIPEKLYDFIIANPPFRNNQDIDHIQHMYKWLKPGGILVSVMSRHYLNSENKKESAFREWCLRVGAVNTWLPKNAFRDSGVNCETQILVIR